MPNGSELSPCARALFYLSQDRVHVDNVAVLQLLELRTTFIPFRTWETSQKCTHLFVLDGMSRVFALLQASLVLTANLNTCILGLL